MIQENHLRIDTEAIRCVRRMRHIATGVFKLARPTLGGVLMRLPSTSFCPLVPGGPAGPGDSLGDDGWEC